MLFSVNQSYALTLVNEWKNPLGKKWWWVGVCTYVIVLIEIDVIRVEVGENEFIIYLIKIECAEVSIKFFFSFSSNCDNSICLFYIVREHKKRIPEISSDIIVSSVQWLTLTWINPFDKHYIQCLSYLTRMYIVWGSMVIFSICLSKLNKQNEVVVVSNPALTCVGLNDDVLLHFRSKKKLRIPWIITFGCIRLD